MSRGPGQPVLSGLHWRKKRGEADELAEFEPPSCRPDPPAVEALGLPWRLDMKLAVVLQTKEVS